MVFNGFVNKIGISFDDVKDCMDDVEDFRDCLYGIFTHEGDLEPDEAEEYTEDDEWLEETFNLFKAAM